MRLCEYVVCAHRLLRHQLVTRLITGELQNRAHKRDNTTTVPLSLNEHSYSRRQQTV